MATNGTESRFRSAVAKAATLDRSIKALDAKARATIRQMAAAVKSGESETVNLHRKVLEANRDSGKVLKDDIADLTAEVLDLEKDRVFLTARQSDLARLTKSLGALRKLLDELLDAIAEACNSARDDLKEREFEAWKGFRAIQAKAVGALASAGTLGEKVEQAAKRADSCDRAGDRAGVEAALATLADIARTLLPPALKALDGIEGAVRDYVRQWSPNDNWSGLKDIGKNVNQLRDDAIVARKTLDMARRRLDDAARLKPKPIDVEKAARLLKLERYKDQLRTALDAKADRQERALDEVAKKAGLTERGKDLLRKLARAGLA